MSLAPPIGILGGTFDPIHMGHLRLAIEAHENLSLEKVHIIPCFQPVHRTPPTASETARFKMVQAAILTEPALFADPREIARRNPSYMIDTLLELRAEKPHTPLCLLLGVDAFLNFHTWHRFKEILDIAHLVIAHRPFFQPPAEGVIAEIIKERVCAEVASLHQRLGGALFFLPIPLLDISSTILRAHIAAGKNVRYLLPEKVYEYILEKKCYGG